MVPAETPDTPCLRNRYLCFMGLQVHLIIQTQDFYHWVQHLCQRVDLQHIKCFVIFWHAELLLLLVVVVLPNFKCCIWHNSVFFYIYLCMFIVMYLHGHICYYLLVIHWLSLIPKVPLEFIKFIQGLMETNTETLHSLSDALRSLKGQHKINCIIKYKFN